MNGMMLPTMPLGANIFLPASQPALAGLPIGALPFTLPEFTEVTLPAKQDAEDTGSIEVAGPAPTTTDAEMLLQLAGVSLPALSVAAPTPTTAQVSTPASATPAPVALVPAASVPVTDEAALPLGGQEAIATSPKPQQANAAPTAPAIFPTPALPETPAGTPAPAKPLAEAETPVELPAASAYFVAAGVLADAEKRAVTRPLPKHAPHRATVTPGVADVKAMVREAVILPMAGATPAELHGHALSASSATFDLGTIPARAPDQFAIATRQPAIVDRQLDLARDDLWLGELARDIVAMSDRTEGLSFRLIPRALGQLDVNIAPSDKGLSIHMSASSEDARSIVAAAQPRLVDEIRSQGVRVADASVGQGSAGDGRGGGRGTEARPSLIEIAPLPVEPESASAPADAARGLFA